LEDQIERVEEARTEGLRATGEVFTSPTMAVVFRDISSDNVMYEHP
jgi:hypothetical protein